MSWQQNLALTRLPAWDVTEGWTSLQEWELILVPRSLAPSGGTADALDFPPSAELTAEEGVSPSA